MLHAAALRLAEAAGGDLQLDAMGTDCAADFQPLLTSLRSQLQSEQRNAERQLSSLSAQVSHRELEI